MWLQLQLALFFAVFLTSITQSSGCRELKFGSLGVLNMRQPRHLKTKASKPGSCSRAWKHSSSKCQHSNDLLKAWLPMHGIFGKKRLFLLLFLYINNTIWLSALQRGLCSQNRKTPHRGEFLKPVLTRAWSSKGTWAEQPEVSLSVPVFPMNGRPTRAGNWDNWPGLLKLFVWNVGLKKLSKSVILSLWWLCGPGWRF